VSSHHFKNSKKITLGNLRNARERYNSDEKIVKREDRTSEKIDERTVKRKDRTSEKIDGRTVKRKDRTSEKIDGRIVKRKDRTLEAIDRVAISTVVAGGNRVYVLVKKKLRSLVD